MEDFRGRLFGGEPVGGSHAAIHHHPQDNCQKGDQHGGHVQWEGFCAPQQGDEDQHRQTIPLLNLLKGRRHCAKGTSPF